jgi:multidrug efflux pump subunit AcrB
MKEQHKALEGKYLQQLQFDPELEKSGFTFWTDRMRAVSLFILLVIIGGFIAIKMLPLESQPEVKLGIGVASTVLPGASPETMEDLVTKKLEKEIGKIKGIDKMTSTSRNGISSIVVQFKPEENTTEAIRNLKDRVDFAKKDLPADAKDPIVQEINFSDTPFWTFTIGGKYDGFTLRKYAQTIKDELEKMDQVSEVRIS